MCLKDKDSASLGPSQTKQLSFWDTPTPVLFTGTVTLICMVIAMVIPMPYMIATAATDSMMDIAIITYLLSSILFAVFVAYMEYRSLGHSSLEFNESQSAIICSPGRLLPIRRTIDLANIKRFQKGGDSHTKLYFLSYFLWLRSLHPLRDFLRRYDGELADNRLLVVTQSGQEHRFEKFFFRADLDSVRAIIEAHGQELHIVGTAMR